jgi:DNA polymerase IIIc chi subunit
MVDQYDVQIDMNHESALENYKKPKPKPKVRFVLSVADKQLRKDKQEMQAIRDRFTELKSVVFNVGTMRHYNEIMGNKF